MPKIILVTSTLAMLGLGLGGANAYNTSDNFGIGEQNDLPVHLKVQSGASDDGLITSSTGMGRVTFGYPVRESSNRVHQGYNASDDFGPSSQNDLPVR